MKKILYPLVASALITIVPFLLTFEKGQDIVRGLFGYEEFVLLLLFTLVKNACTTFSGYRKILLQSVLIVISLAIVTTAWIDLQNILAIKDRPTGWYGLLPFLTSTLAIILVWKTPALTFSGFTFVIFVALITHLAAFNQYAAQPLAQFPLINYLERCTPKPIQRTVIPDSLRIKYIVTDSVTITKDFIDSTRSNVVILIESWGIPLDEKRFESQFKVFKDSLKKIGIHNRMYSRTRTAEREDLMQSYSRDSTGRKDTTFLPQIFANIGYKTTFLFGQDSLKHRRNKYIANIGFGETFYGNNQSDNAIANKIDSILANTTQKHFIAWTTSDTRFPLPGFSSIYNSDANAIDSAYTKLLTRTLETIANLARKHPETRFIVQGDHNPILSPIKFQERFYKRWVPFVILN